MATQTELVKKTLAQLADDNGRYPLEAFGFVREGLSFTVHRIHGDVSKKEEKSCHVSGAQLAWGLRDFAVRRYGLLARAVLAHWRITRTSDFGRIVFAMVEAKMMQKTDRDEIHDFDEVYDFAAAFEPPARPQAESRAVFSL